MEAAPLDPSDFLLVRGLYGLRPAFPSSVGAEGVGRVGQDGLEGRWGSPGEARPDSPTYEQGTSANQVVVPVRNIVPMRDDADPLQLAMLGMNPATASLLLNRYVALMPGDWIGQIAANAAMGQYIIALAKLAGVKTLNVVRQHEAVDQVRQWGGDRVVLQGDTLSEDAEALDGQQLSLVLDTVGGTPVGELAKSLKTGGAIVVYALLGGQVPAMPPSEFIYRGLSLHGFWLINWIRHAPRAEIREMYQKLGDLVAGRRSGPPWSRSTHSTSARKSFTQSLQPHRSGKILFTFGAPEGAVPWKAPATTT